MIENFEDMKRNTVREWVSMLAPKTETYNRFKNFLYTFIEAKGHRLYNEIRKMKVKGELYRV